MKISEWLVEMGEGNRKKVEEGCPRQSKEQVQRPWGGTVLPGWRAVSEWQGQGRQGLLAHRGEECGFTPRVHAGAGPKGFTLHSP